MQTSLIGYTGFVGSNLCATMKFDSLYNSKNIENAFGSKPDVLYFAGLRAEKFLANNAPEKDMELVLEAEKNIARMQPKSIVLISTIDVFKDSVDKNEDAIVETEELHAYGANRLKLEQWVQENFSDYLIIRLPGLFGKNIKKNFIFDYINVIPSMLKQDKFDELSAKEPKLNEFYTLLDNGFYKRNDLNVIDREMLKKIFMRLNFSALNFTDSRSSFQFYPLERLAKDIDIARRQGIKLLHMATEPVSAGELYQYLTGAKFENFVTTDPANYDFKTKYAFLFGGKNGYIMTKAQVLDSIYNFVNGGMWQ